MGEGGRRGGERSGQENEEREEEGGAAGRGMRRGQEEGDERRSLRWGRGLSTAVTTLCVKLVHYFHYITAPVQHCGESMCFCLLIFVLFLLCYGCVMHGIQVRVSRGINSVIFSWKYIPLICGIHIK